MSIYSEFSGRFDSAGRSPRQIDLTRGGTYDPAKPHMTSRRKTRKLIVGDDRVGRVGIGGDAPVSVQTMTAGYTHDVDACVAEIHKLAAAGADMVRVAVPERKDTDALRHILPQVSVPIVADV